jgi:hypothetical protein
VNIATEPETVSPVRRFSIAIPEGPDGPGGGSDTPTTRASNIDFDAAGTPQLSYRQLNQVYTAWTDGQAWASLAFPGPPLDFAVDAGGTAWAATRASDYTGPIDLSRRNGLDLVTEPLTSDEGQWDVLILDDAGTMRVLVSQVSGPVRLFTHDGTAWQPREFPEEAGQNPRDMLAATLAGGRLRIADAKWVYTQSAGDALVAAPIEFPASIISFDSAGRLHAVSAAKQDGAGWLYYTREP